MLPARMTEPHQPVAVPGERPVRAATSGSTSTETEWQFDAVDLRPVDRWLRSQQNGPPDGPDLGYPSVTQQTDLYADTSDWRLHRAGFVLRIRRKRGRAEATLKSISPAKGGLRKRTEITEQVRSPDLDALRRGDGPVGRRIGAMSGSRPLVPVLTVRTRRTAFALRLDGREVGEVALDSTTIPLASGEEPVRLRRVEVELQEPDDPRIEGFVTGLRDGAGLWPAGVSKFEAGVLAAGLDPAGPTSLGPTHVDETSPIGEVAFSVLRVHFAALLEEEPGTRLGDDPEELHDMRVAARRLRAALALFAEILPVRAERFRKELKWIANALGDVRDLDVQLEQLDEWEGAVQDEDRRGLEAVRSILEGRRVHARVELTSALDSPRYDRLVSGFSTMLRHGPLKRPASRVPALLVGPDLIERRHRAVRKGGRRIDAGSPPEAYHRLRIQAKRLRYALEFMTPVYGERALALVKKLVSLQDVLGEHQDAQVAIARLRALALEGNDALPPEAVFAMGMIAERYRVKAAGLREAFGPAFRALSARWRSLERTMERKRASVSPSATLPTPAAVAPSTRIEAV
jgi:triphosphatase